MPVSNNDHTLKTAVLSSLEACKRHQHLRDQILVLEAQLREQEKIIERDQKDIDRLIQSTGWVFFRIKGEEDQLFSVSHGKPPRKHVITEIE